MTEQSRIDVSGYTYAHEHLHIDFTGESSADGTACGCTG